jgi:hypothetical protein
MSLPEIDDDELAIYHVDGDREIALAMYIERTGLTSNDTNLMVITEMFDWEWNQRLYGGQEP